MRVTKVRSKILTPLETTGGNFFSLEGFDFLQFKTFRRVIYIPIEGFRYLNPSSEIINPQEGHRNPFSGVIKPQRRITESLQWNYNPPKGHLNPSSGIINPQEGYLNPSSGIINPLEG